MPKVGFNNIFAVRYEVVNVGQLEKLSGDVNPETLKKAGLINTQQPVKILAKGSLKKALNVKAHKFSEAAKRAIETAGGKAEVI
jgi:large subunit ribosomal protein L15